MEQLVLLACGFLAYQLIRPLRLPLLFFLVAMALTAVALYATVLTVGPRYLAAVAWPSFPLLALEAGVFFLGIVIGYWLARSTVHGPEGRRRSYERRLF